MVILKGRVKSLPSQKRTMGWIFLSNSDGTLFFDGLPLKTLTVMLSVVHLASDRSSCVKNGDGSSGGSDSQSFWLFSHPLPTWEVSRRVGLSVTIAMPERCVREGATDTERFGESACWRLELPQTFRRNIWEYCAESHNALSVFFLVKSFHLEHHF